MLNENDLLPEEQANPTLIYELRATYRLSPEEQQALARVHERLAHNADPLPALKIAHSKDLTRSSQRMVSGRSPIQIAGFRQRWLTRFSTLVAAALLVILVGSLALTFSLLHLPGVGGPGSSDFRLMLELAGGRNPSRAEMQVVSNMLSQRFSIFGFSGASAEVVTRNGHLAIQAILPQYASNERDIVETLLQTGKLEFWSTGPSAVPLGQAFDPAQYSQYNPGGKPWFTGKDIDASQVGVDKDMADRPQVAFAMKGSAVGAFGSFTARHVGEYLTITFDRRVIESAVIQTEINGPGVITGRFTEQQAKAIAADLKAGALPAALQVIR